jgi:hypothetical protein
MVRQDLQTPTTTATVTDYTFGNWTTTTPISVTLDSGDGTGSGLAAGYPKYCVDTADICTPNISYSAAIAMTCASDSTCTQYLRYQSLDSLNNTEAVQSSTVKQDLQSPADGTLTATAGNNQVALSWSGFLDGGSGLATANTYKLVRATGATAPTDCSGTALYQGTGASHTDTTVVNGIEYSTGYLRQYEQCLCRGNCKRHTGRRLCSSSRDRDAVSSVRDIRSCGLHAYNGLY